MNERIKQIQTILGVSTDGVWGTQSQAALNALIHSKTPLASSFADPADVLAFRRCKAAGGSDMECFRVGDNGIGCWGDSVAEGTGNACAVPPDKMIAKWGSVEAAKYKQIKVIANGRTVACMLKDRMPWEKNITNGAIIDLSPDAVKALGLVPPILIPATWEWA